MNESGNLPIKNEPRRISAKVFFSIIITLSILVGGFVVYYERYLIDDFSDYKMNVKPEESMK